MAGRRIPRLECLECRHVLSAVTLPPGITAVQLEPSSGPAQELVISFDQADVDAITSEFSVPFDTLINGVLTTAVPTSSLRGRTGRSLDPATPRLSRMSSRALTRPT